jgi:hypothetical protein
MLPVSRSRAAAMPQAQSTVAVGVDVAEVFLARVSSKLVANSKGCFLRNDVDVREYVVLRP